MGADRIILIIMALFAVAGGIDKIFGSRFGLGDAFERGILLMGQLFLSMSGMIVLAPVIAKVLSPVVIPVYRFLGADPAMFAGSFLACDMGGYPLALELTENADAARLGGIIAASMLGVTVIFTIPVAMGVIKKEDRPFAAKGLLCGIVTVPVGIFVGGVVAGCSPLFVLKNTVPIIILSLLIALGLWKLERILIKCFTYFGRFMTALAIAGLVVALVERLCKVTIIPGLDMLDGAFTVIGDIALMLAGAFPLMFIVTKLLKRPLAALGRRMNINETSVSGLLTSLVNSIPVFDSVGSMDERGKVINMAFAVSGAFVFGDHLAFTAGSDPAAILGLIAGKLAAGVCAVLLAILMTKKKKGDTSNV